MKRIIFMVFILSISACANVFSHKEMVSMDIDKNQAIKIARHFLDQKKYETKDKDIFLDESNTKWKQFSLNKKFLSDNGKILRKLDGQHFWAVNFCPKQDFTFGDEAWVFINRHSGDVILFFILK